ncbi:MAG: nucleoside phosphorylase [Tannerellaceae bacterium]|jgi:uridine phosphorylase|nr:nucleoside phosphorylase [Tannerellaceae bacterium]
MRTSYKEAIQPSELIINEDGSIFHLHLKPEQLSDKIILVGDPNRVPAVASFFDTAEFDISNREFRSITGTFEGKRLTVLSHGIGSDNIDIVLNELDALANVDFKTRTVKPDFKQLTLVRIGTSGGLQSFMPVGSYVIAEKSIGFDAVIYFYANNEEVRDIDFENELITQLNWQVGGIWPYVVNADVSLVQQIGRSDIPRGITITTNGFYGPQGRKIRLALLDPDLNKKIHAFDYYGCQITNYEMESSALAGLAALMGHRVMTVCCIIASRVDKKVNTDYQSSLTELIKIVLERI